MQPEPSKEKSYSAEFMLKEYERLNELSMATISRSEQRVNFFLTVSSAVIGILLLLGPKRQNTSLSYETLLTIIEAVLVLLLAFGITTLNRVVSGSVQREVYQKLMSHIQRYFATHDSQVAAYLELQKKEREKPKHRFRLVSWILKRHKGRLTDFMVLSNSLICGGIVIAAFLAPGQSIKALTIWALVTVIGSLLFFYGYYEYIRKRLPPF